MNRILASRWTTLAVFLLGLVPAANVAWGLSRTLRGEFVGALSANPIEYVTHFTGDWTIRFLLITLAVTPLRNLLHRPQITRFRRMLGLFAFFYGFLHLMTWVWLDRFFAPEGIWTGMWQDIAKRPYITVGMLGFLMMLPLALTSTNGWVRRLTWKRWRKLHRLVYLVPVAGVVHFWWLVKSDVSMPQLYAAILAVLLLYRMFLWTRAPKPATRPLPPAMDAAEVQLIKLGPGAIEAVVRGLSQPRVHRLQRVALHHEVEPVAEP